MTQRRYIKTIFNMYPNQRHFTCSDITKLVRKQFGLTSKYLSGGISSTLAKMVVQGELQVTPDTVTGPRGGKCYEKGPNFLL